MRQHTDLDRAEALIAEARSAAPESPERARCLTAALERVGMAAWHVERLRHEALRLDAIPQLIRLCELIGLRVLSEQDEAVPLSGYEQAQHLATHEASHAVMYALRSVDFFAVSVLADKKTNSDGQILNRPIAPNREPTLPPVALQLCCLVAGGVGEEIIFGPIRSFTIEIDLRLAFTILGVTRPSNLKAGDEAIVQLRSAVDASRVLLSGQRAAIETLATELRRTGMLSRDDCLELLRSAGLELPDVPAFDLQFFYPKPLGAEESDEEASALPPDPPPSPEPQPAPEDAEKEDGAAAPDLAAEQLAAPERQPLEPPPPATDVDASTAASLP